jgi:Cys-tRNA(Pro) deacylase
VKQEVPVTTAIRFLRAQKAIFEPFFYQYEERGGTATSARELGVEENVVIKTLVMQDESKKPLIVLMHGDRQVSTKQLARILGVKSITACEPDVANRHSGYVVGGTSPFATKKPMPVYMQKTILECPQVYINGGKRGFLVRMSPREILRLLNAQLVDVVA